MNDMSPALLSALSADLAVPNRWKMIGLHTSLAAAPVPVPPALPGPGTRHITATLTSTARALTLVFMLEGPEEGPSVSLKMHYQGTPFETDDAAMIARIDNAVAPMLAHREAELLAKLAEDLT